MESTSSISGEAVSQQQKASLKPFVLSFREPMSGAIVTSVAHGDQSTYMGQTACPPGNGVPDYESD